MSQFDTFTTSPGTIAGLTNGVSYRTRLVARNAAGDSLPTAWSDPFTPAASGTGGYAAGFFNATPATKPTVTGSRATTAALESLLAALVSLGLITNSTTA